MIRNSKLFANQKALFNRGTLCPLNYLRSFQNFSNKKSNSHFLNVKLLKKSLNHNHLIKIRHLTDIQYEKLVGETLECLNDYFDELLENQTKITNYDLSLSDGVLTINLDTFGTYVINKQTPNKQIWISSPISGPKRYDYIDGVWIYKHDNRSLHDLLNHEISSILELNDIDFKKCWQVTKR